MPFDKTCEEVVEVLEHNRIQSISLSGDYIKGDGADSYILKSSDEVKIIVHTAVPLNGDEQLRLLIDKHLTQDVAVEMPKMVSVIADTDCSSYYFTLKPSFFNNRNSKKIDVILTDGKQTTRINYFNSGLLDSKSLTIKEVSGYVSANVSHDIFGKDQIFRDSCVRPDTTVCLTVSPSEAYDNVLDLKDAVWEIVENKVSQEPKPKGALAFHKLKTEGKVTIKLDLSKCGSVISNGKVGVTKYEHTINVSRNVIKGIANAPKTLYPEIRYPIKFELLYEYDCLLDKSLNFNLDDKEKVLTSDTYDVSFDTVGKHSLKYGKKGNFEFDVVSPSVKTWQFSDDRNNRINEVGLDETFYLDIDIPAWADYQKNVFNSDEGVGKVQFFLWENKAEHSDPIAIDSLKNAKMSSDGNAHVALKISKDELARHLGTYQFPEKISIIASLINPPYAASELLSQKSCYSGHWVCNSAIPLTLVTQPCVNGFFSGKSGNPQKSVMKYGDPMYIILTTHNCKNQLDKISVELVENDKKGETDDRVVAVYSNLDFDENGKVKIDISGDVKEDDHGENPNPRLFYFRVYLDGKQIYTYPQTPADVFNMTYKEAEGKSNTAKVELDGESYSMSKSDDSCDYESALKIRSYLWQLKVGKDKEIERLNKTLAMMAPVVVGEELRKGEKGDKPQKCPNCNKDITLVDLKSICVDANGKCLIKDLSKASAILPDLNKYRKIAHIDTCIRKAYFIAQVCAETKFYQFEEDFTYSSEALKEMKKFNTAEGKKKAELWGYNKAEAARDESKKVVSKDNQMNIANWKYAFTNGNGDFKSGDGYTFRGRGLIHLTGRENYKKRSIYCNKNFLTDNDPQADWENNPEEVSLNYRDVVLSALCFWTQNHINQYAEKATDKCGKRVSQIVNGDEKAWNNINDDITREEYFRNAVQVLKVVDCKKNVGLEGKEKQTFCTYDKRFDIDSNESNIAYIDVIVPKNRKREGVLVVFDNTGIRFKTYCLCKGSHGKREIEQGDTPTGLAKTQYIKHHIGDERYGNHGLIHLYGEKINDRENGEFYNVMHNNASKTNRSGIAIHAGHTRCADGSTEHDITKDTGMLMQTQGCVRVYNEAMRELVAVYETLVNEGKTVKCYVEDYSGDIDDVFDFYCLNLDFKDKTR